MENNVKDQEEMINEKEMNLQLAENENIDNVEISDCIEKRKMLEKTKIVKQTWSIVEIYKKIKNSELILNPDYQRNPIWKRDKQVAFIESLFMGIVVPPIYVVEIPEQEVLEGNKYEVVDGKQRLNTIQEFLNGKIQLEDKYLEYYGDIYGGKNFLEIKAKYAENINEFLSSVLDVYVITANSPEFTKYDIFARLNKGAEKLKVNEIRKAVYRSSVLEKIEIFVRENCEKQFYMDIFTENDIMRYDDFGRFFSSLAYYMRINIEKRIFENYNSRPREMINDILSGLQNGTIYIDDNTVSRIIDETIKLMDKFKSTGSKRKYLVDACIYFAVNDQQFYEKIDKIIYDKDIDKTFTKSPSTTSNVNERLERIISILNE
ncbi:hypothetical protein N492_10100 [Clostridium botulinum B2 267]|uniref:DUF262 domain-containing protein n=1 Tax=Clostridium botulinum TaxID=1491 RepID=UPI0007E0D0FB|nr:DUF262 domain-containing protein [Clostridium botulinum]KEI87339.1 hypothetical protein N492_10100 [Clostridium botulinum B2 267]